MSCEEVKDGERLSFFSFFFEKGFVVVERSSIEAAPYPIALSLPPLVERSFKPEKPWRTESLVSFFPARDPSRERRGRRLARGAARKGKVLLVDDDRYTGRMRSTRVGETFAFPVAPPRLALEELLCSSTEISHDVPLRPMEKERAQRLESVCVCVRERERGKRGVLERGVKDKKKRKSRK